jgi:hypothetical protein
MHSYDAVTIATVAAADDDDDDSLSISNGVKSFRVRRLLSYCFFAW